MKEEFSAEIEPDVIDDIMNEEYTEALKKHWAQFNKVLKEEKLHWSESLSPEVAESFAGKHFNDDAEKLLFMERHKVLTEIGCRQVFTGKGYTERESEPGRLGALETLEIQSKPESVKGLMKENKIISIPLVHPNKRLFS